MRCTEQLDITGNCTDPRFFNKDGLQNDKLLL